MANATVDINVLRTLIEKLATDDAFRDLLAKKPAEVLSGMSPANLPAVVSVATVWSIEAMRTSSCPKIFCQRISDDSKERMNRISWTARF